MPDSDAGRNIHERVGALEQDMKNNTWRLERLERVHDDIPNRVTSLELIASAQTKLLEKMDANQQALGQKVWIGLGVGGALMGIINLIGPHLLKAVLL